MRTLKPVFFSLTAILGATSSRVFARAGGGEGYSGGGEGGFGGAPSSDGFSANFPEASPLDGGAGGFGAGGGSTLGMLVALVVILALLWFLSRRKLSGQRGLGTPLGGGSGPGISSTTNMSPSRLWKERPSQPPSAEALRMLQALPGLFVAIQKAWSEQKLERVRREVSDGVYSRWQIQIDLMRREGRRNLALQPQLLQSRVLHESREGDYEAMDFLIRASLVDLDQGEGAPIPSSEKNLPPPTIFEEVWSFTRKRRAIRPGEAKQEFDFGSHCGNCAAPLSGTQGVKCPSCGAILNSGAYDWVLAEITQVDVWSPNSRSPGQGLSRQEIEDRASTVFVRLVQTHLEQRPGLLRPYAEEAVVEQLQRGVSPLQGMSLQKIALGKVEFEASLSEDSRMLAKVRVKFSGGKNTMLANPQYGDIVMVFAKAISPGSPGAEAGNHAMSGSGLNSLNCPQCGAPVGGSEQARCGYCNETLNDPQHHWVLAGFESFGWKALSRTAP